LVTLSASDVNISVPEGAKRLSLKLGAGPGFREGTVALHAAALRPTRRQFLVVECVQVSTETISFKGWRGWIGSEIRMLHWRCSTIVSRQHAHGLRTGPLRGHLALQLCTRVAI